MALSVTDGDGRLSKIGRFDSAFERADPKSRTEGLLGSVFTVEKLPACGVIPIL